MPKRKNEEMIEMLTKRLKQLEKEIKGTRRNRRSSSSSSCSQGSSCSQRSVSSSSSSPAASIDHENPNVRNAATPAVDEEPTLQPVDTQPRHVEPEPGPSNAPSLIPEPLPEVPSAAEIPKDNEDDICQSDLLEILGSDPSQTQEFGEDINKDVASRFEYIATSGLEKQAEQDLLDKYLVPLNCKKIAAPQLNAEIKAASNETVVKRDKSIESRQKQLAAAITAIGRMLTSQLRSKDKDSNISKQLMEVGRILCDIQHNDSSARRNFALYSLKKEFREQLSITKIDKYLFGIDLPETLKTAKAVSKSGTDIKINVQKQKQTPAKLPKNLNWKAGASARSQQKAPTQKQQPATSTSRRHGTSSHRSSHRAKQPRRR